MYNSIALISLQTLWSEYVMVPRRNLLLIGRIPCSASHLSLAAVRLQELPVLDIYANGVTRCVASMPGVFLLSGPGVASTLQGADTLFCSMSKGYSAVCAQGRRWAARPLPCYEWRGLDICAGLRGCVFTSLGQTWVKLPGHMETLRLIFWETINTLAPGTASFSIPTSHAWRPGFSPPSPACSCLVCD